MSIKEAVKKAEHILLFLLFFVYPLLFSPLFTDVFATTKFLFLTVVVVLVLLLKGIKVIVSRRLDFFKSPFDNVLYLLVVAFLLSTIISAPNKVEALIDANRGAVPIIFWVLLLFGLPKNKKLAVYASLSSLFILFLMLVGSYFSLFKFLPENFAFINNKSFTPFGSLLDLALYAGFFLALALDSVQKHPGGKAEFSKEEKRLLQVSFILTLPLVLLSVYIILKDSKIIFLPFSISWQITVEGLKNLRVAVFGVGPANFVSLFTQAKPLSFNNLETLWQANVEFSHSALLHIFSEVGLLGTMSLVLILLNLFYKAKQYRTVLSYAVLLAWFVFFPVSYNLYFLLFIALFLLREEERVRQVDLKDLDVILYSFVTILLVVVIAISFFSYRVFAAEYYLARSFAASAENNAQTVYDYQRKASTLNPFNERVRLTFSQTNILLANSLAQKKKISDQDRQTIATLVQQAINEGKALVSLNIQKAAYWANLASIYRNLLTIAQGADAWAISSYQRAIALDRNNPNYYYNLGVVYYALRNYNEATKFFEQATVLKPNIANFHYNLAWANFQIKDYRKAVNAMESALRFVEVGSDDYKKAKKELEDFKKKLPKEEVRDIFEEEEKLSPEELVQPSPIPSVTPQIELDEENAPPRVPTTTPTPKP